MLDVPQVICLFIENLLVIKKTIPCERYRPEFLEKLADTDLSSFFRFEVVFQVVDVVGGGVTQNTAVEGIGTDETFVVNGGPVLGIPGQVAVAISFWCRKNEIYLTASSH